MRSFLFFSETEMSEFRPRDPCCAGPLGRGRELRAGWPKETLAICEPEPEDREPLGAQA